MKNTFFRLILAIISYVAVGATPVMAQGFLGADIAGCGPVTLNAQNPGAVYQWSTGASSQTITISPPFSDTVTVIAILNGTVYSDSITVDLASAPAAPNLRDTTVCGNGVISLPAYSIASGGDVLWYNQATGGKRFAIGASAQVPVGLTNKKVYGSVAQTSVVSVGGAITPSGTLAYSTANQNNAGISILAQKALTLKSVVVYTNTPTRCRIELRTTTNVILDSLTVTIPNIGKNTIPLYFNLPAAAAGATAPNLRLVATNFSYGTLGTFNNGLLFPYSLPLRLSVTGDHTNATTTYRYFFELNVAGTACESPRDSALLTISPTPVTNLGKDSFPCNTTPIIYSLNNAANTQYAWSTGGSTSSITVNSTGVYSVSANIGSCFARDTVEVEYIAPPALPVLPASISVCASDTVALNATTTADEVFWYSQASGGTPIAIGKKAYISAYTNTTVYAEAVDFNTPKVTGYKNTPTLFAYVATQNAGVSFNVLDASILESVAVYTNQPTRFVVELLDANNVVIASKAVSLSLQGPSKSIIPLYFSLPVGNNLKLRARDIVGMMAQTTSGLGYPYSLPGVMIITGDINGLATATSTYRYFFEWKIGKKACRSNRVAQQINILPTPVVELGKDTTVCSATSFLLNATAPNATSYTWSGAGSGSSAFLSATNSGTYRVMLQNASCAYTDSVYVGFTAAVNKPNAGADTTLCASNSFKINVKNKGNGATILWYNQAVGGNPVAVGDTATVVLTGSTSPQITNFYAEAINISSSINTGYQNSLPASLLTYSNSSTANNGLSFHALRPFVLNSVSVYLSQPLKFTIELLTATGTVPIISLPVVINQTGKVTIPLQFSIPAGMAYRLRAVNITDLNGFVVGGGLGGTTSNVQFPYIVPGVLSIFGDQTGTVSGYRVFFEWQISRDICRSVRDTLVATALPTPSVELGIDTFACGTTPVVLNAAFANPGTLYQWSGASTANTASVTAATPGEYRVKLQILYPQYSKVCVAQDSIEVGYVPAASQPIFKVKNGIDTTLCSTTSLSVQASATGATDLLWYRQATGGNYVATGTQPTLTVSSSTNFYVEAVNIGNTTTIGYQYASATARPKTFVATANLGMVFNAIQPFFLYAVTMYANKPTRCTVEVIRPPLNTVIATRVVVLKDTGMNVVPLYMRIPAMSGLVLRARNITDLAGTAAGGLGVVTGANTTVTGTAYGSAAYSIPNVVSIISDQTNGAINYNYFFAWKVSRKACITPRSLLAVKVRPTPKAKLGGDKFVCGTTPVSLNAAFPYPNIQYQWYANGAKITGATSATYSVPLPGGKTYKVIQDLDGCVNQDSAYIEYLNSPTAAVIPDTTACYVSKLRMIAKGGSGTGTAVWYDAPAAGNIVAIGDTAYLSYSQATTTTKVYVERIALSKTGSAGALQITQSQQQQYLSGGSSGIRIAANAPCVLSSVKVQTNQPTSFTVELRDNASGALLASRNISITATGVSQTEISLFFSMPAGTYNLVATNLVGGLLCSTQAFPYPYTTLNGLVSLISDNLGNTTYRYFLECKFSRAQCTSGRDISNITFLPTPTFPSPVWRDTALCGSSPLALNATVTLPNTSYLWSTGATASSINVTQSGLYWVEINKTNAGAKTCSIRDSINALFIPTPTVVNRPDTSVCGSTVHTFTIPGAAQKYDGVLWYSPTTMAVVGNNQYAPRLKKDTTLLWAGYKQSPVISTGIKSVAVYQYGNNNDRGLLLDAKRDFVLERVTVYSAGATSFTVEVQNATGTVTLFSANYSTPAGGTKATPLATVLPIFYQMQAGTIYRLVAKNMTGSGLAFHTGALTGITTYYPIAAQDLLVIANESRSQSTARYDYFYDIKISQKLCVSAMDAIKVTVKLPLDLPALAHACDTVTLDATTPGGVSYQWTRLDTTPILTFNNPIVKQTDSSLFAVIVSDNKGCTIYDTVTVEIPKRAGLPNLYNGIVCDSILFTNYSLAEGAIFEWNGDPGITTDTFRCDASIGTPTFVTVKVIEPGGCTLTDMALVLGFDTSPKFTLPDSTLCDTALTLVAPIDPVYSYQWSNSVGMLGTQAAQKITQTDLYYLTITKDTSQCRTRDTANISLNPVLSAAFQVFVTPGTTTVQLISSGQFAQYMWYFGDGNTSTDASVPLAHTYAAPGIYNISLVLIDPAGICPKDSVFYGNVLSGISQEAEKLFRVFPNPTDSFLTIESLGNTGLPIYATVLNAAGQVAFRRELLNNATELDVSPLAQGMYTLHLVQGEKTASFSFLKK